MHIAKTISKKDLLNILKDVPNSAKVTISVKTEDVEFAKEYTSHYEGEVELGLTGKLGGKSSDGIRLETWAETI